MNELASQSSGDPEHRPNLVEDNITEEQIQVAIEAVHTVGDAALRQLRIDKAESLRRPRRTSPALLGRRAARFFRPPVR